MPSDRKIINGVEHVVHTKPDEPMAPVVQPLPAVAGDDEKPASLAH